MAQGKLTYKILGVVVGLVFVGYGFIDRAEINKVKKRGVSAVVKPITGYTEHKSRGSSTYMAEFRFMTDSGREVVQKHSFPGELIADFKSGAPVRVLYMPNDPETFVFEKDQPSWMLVIGGGVLAIAALIFA